jgi:hypothetical protein
LAPSTPSDRVPKFVEGARSSTRASAVGLNCVVPVPPPLCGREALSGAVGAVGVGADAGAGEAEEGTEPDDEAEPEAEAEEEPEADVEEPAGGEAGWGAPEQGPVAATKRDPKDVACREWLPAESNASTPRR